MAEPVVVVAGDASTPPAAPDAATAFAAGAATVVAAQADETAQAAVEAAVDATATADQAAEAAHRAEMSVYDVDDRVSALEKTMTDLIGDLIEHLDGGGATGDPDGVPPVVTAQAIEVTATDADKPKGKAARKRGDWWWGGR